MKKVVRIRYILLGVVGGLFLIFFLIFLASKVTLGNVALIPIVGQITVDGTAALGSRTVSSEDIVAFITEADANPQVKAIVLEINSPGGSAVASDEIAAALKKTEKPVVALIREVGASGGYWVASAADYVVANRMSITGSIGVISSYLEFSGLMEKYGVGYERLIVGERKDLGTPFRELSTEERKIMERKLAHIHNFFIEEIAENRRLPKEKVKEMATGEFFLGVEALPLGLVDELGNLDAVEEYLKQQGLTRIDYIRYEKKASFVESLAGVWQDLDFPLKIVNANNRPILI